MGINTISIAVAGLLSLLNIKFNLFFLMKLMELNTWMLPV